MKKTSIFIIFVILFVSFQNVYACSPGPGYPFTMEDNFERHENIFVGRVTSVTQDKNDESRYKVQFETIKVYKGDFNHSVVVTINGSSAACGYDEPIGIFNKNSVWAIYADTELNTMSLSQNQQYESVEKAVAALDAVIGIPKVCSLQYEPVCGRKDTGIRCVTTPCDSFEHKTYGNSCLLTVDKAEYLYDGTCKDEGIEISDPIPVEADVVVDSTTSTVATTTIEVEISQGSFFDKVLDFLKRTIFFWR